MMVRTSVLVRARSGVTLIMVAGVLSLLAALGSGFYTVCMMQSKSAQRYSDTTRAGLMAQGGMADAIARLHELAYVKIEDASDSWYTVNYCDNLATRSSFAALDKNVVGNQERFPGDWITSRTTFSRAPGNSASTPDGGSDRYTLKIIDAASRININAGDNLGVLMDNLCRVIGIPLVPADLNYIQPRRWAVEGANAALYGVNTNDTSSNRDLYYQPSQAINAPDTPPIRSPLLSTIALYGDGYAIARYRSAHGKFKTLDEVKLAVTVVANPLHPELETLERELKFAALKDCITIDSWVDTNSVCTGKFEWADAGYDFAIDRDKSWIADDPADVLNARGSLRGCYVSIVNGHGAGQLRRIKTNGIDWIQLDGGPWQIPPGPISSYMIIAKEDATIGSDGLPQTDSLGKLLDDPNIDYLRRPLCIHRAPVNINTASDKVLMAMFLGIDVQHGHPLSVGTDVDYTRLVKDPLPSLYAYSATGLTINNKNGTDWKALDDALLSESYLLTPRGLKRIPADSGMPVLDRPVPWDLTNADKTRRFAYLNNFNSLTTPQYLSAGGTCNEVHELAYRILIARQPDADEPYLDPLTGNSMSANNTGYYKRGPFRSWDDLFFRVIKPWDDKRVTGSLGVGGYKKKSVARMIMAHFNSNTDILKFNPNIEWIDRWGRNFSEMEAVMIFGASGPRLTTSYSQQFRPDGNKNPGAQPGAYYLRGRRYQADEMIDKTDMNRSTTEFAFDSSGVFEIQSAGQVVKDGTCMAERKILALVKIYDVWRETTQRQFVNGTFSNALQKNKNGTSSGFTDAGKVARDATNVSDFKALDTLPEALVPLKYTLNAPSPRLNTGGTTAAIVERLGSLNNWLNPPQARGTIGTGGGGDQYTPDIVANKVLPASYDGQIVLAANTTAFNNTIDGDTFLASFNGDLDTATCLGNGRELAKTPVSTQRVVDTVGLLGALCDGTTKLAEVDVDPDAISSFFRLPVDNTLTTKTNDTDPVTGGGSSTPYWQNIECRLGDLRVDGVWLGAGGISAKDGTLKYETAGNFPPMSTQQMTIQMWMKSTWHVNDGYEHEFFNATDLSNGKTIAISKGRQFAGTTPYDGSGSNLCENRDCLVLTIEDKNDQDYLVALHDGERKIPPQYVALPGVKGKLQVETPAYKIQPFRWSNVGAWARWKILAPLEAVAPNFGNAQNGFTTGFAQAIGAADPYYQQIVSADQGYGRPFIDTQRDPEGANWSSKYHWFWRWLNNYNVAGYDVCTANGQDLAWGLAAQKNTTRVFSINNYDRDTNGGGSIGRVVPSTGTEAVIDELKISNKAWSSVRIADEQTLSRYYLPGDPKTPGNCPLFTSQSLLQSLRGLNTAAQPEFVTLARVTWTVFTPRFMHENKDPHTYSRKEQIGGGAAPVPTPCYFRGPFDYVQYNRDIGYDALQGWKTTDGTYGNPKQPDMDLEVDRKPPPFDKTSGTYLQAQATKGVEVELLNGANPVGNTYIDPNVQNSIGTPAIPIRVSTDMLHYRVRFRYPVDNVRVDKQSTNTVFPDKQYLLDTPVFDDISITYFTKPKILSYKELSE